VECSSPYVNTLNPGIIPRSIAIWEDVTLANKYYTIGEISKLYGIGRDSLMYYEEIGLLKPMRGENNYRLYTLTDIWKLNTIKELRALGFPMEKIKQYIEGRSLHSTTEILKEEVTIIESTIEQLQAFKSDILKRLEDIEKLLEHEKLDTPDMAHFNERTALILHERITRDEEFDFLVRKLQRDREEEFYILGNPRIGAIYDFESIKHNVFNQYEAVFTVLPEGREGDIKFPAGTYATVAYKGPYTNNKTHITELIRFIEAQGYAVAGSPIEFYRIDIHETRIPEEFLTEIQIPVKKAS